MKENLLKKLISWIFGHKNSADSATKIYTGIITLVEVFSTFCPINDAIEAAIPQTLKRAVTVLICLIVLWIIIYFVVRLYDTHCRKEKVLVTTNNNHEFKLQYGDIINILKDERLGPRSIVVDFNDCFDTIVDNNLISDETMHGKVLKALYKDGYTTDNIDTLIKENLDSRRIKPAKTLTENQKSYGNRNEYPLGTIADIHLDKYDATLFLVGMSHFDKNFKVEPDEESFHRNVFKIINHINTFSQGKPVYMPIIGTGLTRLNKSQSQIVRYFKNVVDMFKDLLPCDLTMVVYDKKKDIDISDF